MIQFLITQMSELYFFFFKSLCGCHGWENLFFVPDCEGVQICFSKSGHFHMWSYGGLLAFGGAIQGAVGSIFQHPQILSFGCKSNWAVFWAGWVSPSPGKAVPHLRSSVSKFGWTQATSLTSQGCLLLKTPILSPRCQIRHISANGDQTKPHQHEIRGEKHIAVLAPTPFDWRAICGKCKCKHPETVELQVPDWDKHSKQTEVRNWRISVLKEGHTNTTFNLDGTSPDLSGSLDWLS